MSISRPHFFEILIPAMGPDLHFGGQATILSSHTWRLAEVGCREEGKGHSHFFRANVCLALVRPILCIMVAAASS